MQEEVNRVIKRANTRDPVDDGSLLYLDCSGTVLIHVIELQRTKHTHTHRIVSLVSGALSLDPLQIPNDRCSHSQPLMTSLIVSSDLTNCRYSMECVH